MNSKPRDTPSTGLDNSSELARVLAVLRLASEEATAVLVAALTAKAVSIADDIVLTDEQESAYQQTVWRINRLLTAANPIDLYKTDQDGHQRT